VIQGSRGATAFVGMPGFVVGAQRLVGGELCCSWKPPPMWRDARGVGLGRGVMAGPPPWCVTLPISGRPTVL
jgi:hypothetical protein